MISKIVTISASTKIYETNIQTYEFVPQNLKF
jgi:hypothetical protein